MGEAGGGGGGCLPDAQELGLFPGGAGLTLHLQGVDVGDGDDGGRDVPGQAGEGAHDDQHRHPEQVQVVARPFLQEDQSEPR